MYALALLALAACGGTPAPAPAEVPVAAPPAAPAPEAAPVPEGASVTVHPVEEGKSLPFTLVVGMSPEATKLLQSKGEGVEISVVLSDGNAGDEGGFREQRFEVPADGGIVNVLATDLSPVKGRPLVDFSINAYSTRKSSETNLVNCSFVGGAVKEIAPRMTVECKPL